MSMILVVSCDDQKGKYTSETYDWKTPVTDSLKLTATYQGMDFETNGIGEVKKLVRCVDGDTTVFELHNGKQITVRYNGINTPESTYRIEAWGFASSKYAKSLFAKAQEEGAKIVLQTENINERFDSTGQRYLAWVWFVYPSGDSRLVNLEMAEMAYAHVKSAAGTQYYQYFLDAIEDVSKYGLRIYGETDTTYDYSTEGREMTIKEIRETYGTEDAVNGAAEGYESQLIKVSGVVARKSGETNAYLQQYDAETGKYYGIYVYGGYNSISKLIEGAYVQITAKVGYYYGALQITDVTSDSKIKVYSFNAKDQIVATEKEVDAINDIYAYDQIGSLVTVHNLTVTSCRDSANNDATTLYCSYGNNKTIKIRINQEVVLRHPETGQKITSGDYFVGKTFASLTGIVAYYNGDTTNLVYSEGDIQLALTSMDDIVFAE